MVGYADNYLMVHRRTSLYLSSPRELQGSILGNILRGKVHSWEQDSILARKTPFWRERFLFEEKHSILGSNTSYWESKIPFWGVQLNFEEQDSILEITASFWGTRFHFGGVARFHFEEQDSILGRTASFLGSILGSKIPF